MLMILVCGEALVDLFVDPPRGMTLSARAVAGGSPFNVAIGLSRLGCPSGFLSGLSRDRFGSFLTELLEREGVETRYARRSERLSTISVVATDADGHPQYSFHGEGAADRMLSVDDLPATLPDSVRAVTFGSYTLAVDPVGEAYATLAEREGRNRVISIDPNLRPTITTDMTHWHRRFERFLATAGIVKVSTEDLETAYGAQRDYAEIARDWRRRDIPLVVVTRGAEGATAFFGRDETLSLPGRKVRTQDTVGAGDTFHAALLARLDALDRLNHAALATLDRETVGSILDYAIAAAAITCSRQGADLPRADEVEAIL